MTPDDADTPSRQRAAMTPARWRRRLGRRLAVGDVVVISVSSGLAYITRLALGESGLVRELANVLPAAIGVIPLWLVIFHSMGAYRPEYLNAGGDAFRRFVAGCVGGLFATGFVSFAFNLDLARLFVALLGAYVLLLGGAMRVAVRAYLRSQRRRGSLRQNVLVVGTDLEARQLVAALAAADGAGYDVVGYLDDDHSPGSDVAGLPVVGGILEATDVAERFGVGLVIVSSTGVPPGTLRDLTVLLEGGPIDLAVAPSLFQVVTRRVAVEYVANVAVLHVDQIRLTGLRAALKRTLDVLVAACLLVLLAPVMAATAAIIRLSDRGPALFRQERVGRDGEAFTLLKFRTMVVDAEARLDDVRDLNEAGQHFFKIRDDPRLTAIGRRLRKWSLDETPQLWNVLRGHMSMVGPRPPIPDEVARYDAWHLRRLRVRPGLTGVWQVSGRSEVPFDEAVRMDLFYIENWSLGTDLFLLGKTVLAVLGRTGAY